MAGTARKLTKASRMINSRNTAANRIVSRKKRRVNTASEKGFSLMNENRMSEA